MAHSLFQKPHLGFGPVTRATRVITPNRTFVHGPSSVHYQVVITPPPTAAALHCLSAPVTP